MSNPLQYCLYYKAVRKFLESFGNFIPASVVIWGDNDPRKEEKEKWFRDILQFDKARRKFLGYI